MGSIWGRPPLRQNAARDWTKPSTSGRRPSEPSLSSAIHTSAKELKPPPCDNQTVPAAIRPADRYELQNCMRIANQFRSPYIP
jgi:hypothetical protein